MSRASEWTVEVEGVQRGLCFWNSKVVGSDFGCGLGFQGVGWLQFRVLVRWVATI